MAIAFQARRGELRLRANSTRRCSNKHPGLGRSPPFVDEACACSVPQRGQLFAMVERMKCETQDFIL